MEETEIKNLETWTGYQPEHSLVANFLHWYFAVAPKQMVKIWSGYIQAAWHYFSVWLLLRTLFAPWRRDLTGYGRGFDFKRYLSIWLLNMVARMVGFVVRLAAIIAAIITEVFLLIAGLLILSFWMLAPLTLSYSIFTGVNQFLF